MRGYQRWDNLHWKGHSIYWQDDRNKRESNKIKPIILPEKSRGEK